MRWPRGKAQNGRKGKNYFVLRQVMYLCQQNVLLQNKGPVTKIMLEKYSRVKITAEICEAVQKQVLFQKPKWVLCLVQQNYLSRQMTNACRKLLVQNESMSCHKKFCQQKDICLKCILQKCCEEEQCRFRFIRKEMERHKENKSFVLEHLMYRYLYLCPKKLLRFKASDAPTGMPTESVVTEQKSCLKNYVCKRHSRKNNCRTL